MNKIKLITKILFTLIIINKACSFEEKFEKKEYSEKILKHINRIQRNRNNVDDMIDAFLSIIEKIKRQRQTILCKQQKINIGRFTVFIEDYHCFAVLKEEYVKTYEIHSYFLTFERNNGFYNKDLKPFNKISLILKHIKETKEKEAALRLSDKAIDDLLTLLIKKNQNEIWYQLKQMQYDPIAIKLKHININCNDKINLIPIDKQN